MHPAARFFLAQEHNFTRVLFLVIGLLLLRTAVMCLQGDIMDLQPERAQRHPYGRHKLASSIYVLVSALAYIALYLFRPSHDVSAGLFLMLMVLGPSVYVHTTLTYRELKAHGVDVPEGSDRFWWERWNRSVSRSE